MTDLMWMRLQEKCDNGADEKLKEGEERRERKYIAEWWWVAPALRVYHEVVAMKEGACLKVGKNHTSRIWNIPMKADKDLGDSSSYFKLKSMVLAFKIGFILASFLARHVTPGIRWPSRTSPICLFQDRQTENAPMDVIWSHFL